MARRRRHTAPPVSFVIKTCRTVRRYFRVYTVFPPVYRVHVNAQILRIKHAFT